MMVSDGVRVRASKLWICRRRTQLGAQAAVLTSKPVNNLAQDYKVGSNKRRRGNDGCGDSVADLMRQS